MGREKAAPEPDLAWLANGVRAPGDVEDASPRAGNVALETPESGQMVRKQQALRALAKANDARIKRAHLRERIYQGDLTVLDVLEDGLTAYPLLSKVRVADLLTWQRRWGTMRARRVLQGICSETTTLGQLGSRRASLLADRLRPVTVAVAR